jgi:CRP-like cAMP-binding protein
MKLAEWGLAGSRSFDNTVPTSHNLLVALLPRQDRVLLLSASERVDLTFGQVVDVAGAPTRHVYFPDSGLVSQAAIIDSHGGLEVGMVGREGMVGGHLALGMVLAPVHSLVQGAGTAWRIDSHTFRKQLANSPALQRVMGRYNHVIVGQLTLSMGCQCFHLLGARLARWLLMRQDRAQCDSFMITHESLGHLLGVRRVSVTIEAGALQHLGLIEYTRGALTVLDREGLKAAACSCYAKDRDIYSAVLSRQ